MNVIKKVSFVLLICSLPFLSTAQINLVNVEGDAQSNGIHISNAVDYSILISNQNNTTNTIGLQIENVATDAISIINAGDDGVSVTSAKDDGFVNFSSNEDGFVTVNSGGDGFKSTNAGGDGIFISGSAGFAGYFGGSVNVAGTLAKAAGSFKIDHPLDPENKILYHSFVESPDMMNIYNGNIVLNKDGKATVTLPDWFNALNIDYRYQLTCIGGHAPIYISKKIEDNQFEIAGGNAGLEISWQVTGIRNDAFAQKNRIPVEEEKPDELKGYYLQPAAFNKPLTEGIEYLKQQKNNSTKF